MQENFSGLPDSTVALSALESKMLAFVHEQWPASALDVAAHFRVDLSTRDAKRRASAKFSYYLQKLVQKRLLFSKRVGHALVVWPVSVEKYRALHALLQSESPANQNVAVSLQSESPAIAESELSKSFFPGVA